MSNDTLHMNTDQLESKVFLPHRGKELLFSPDTHYLLVSPDSSCSISYQGEIQASSSPNINMERCFNESSTVGNIENAALAQDDLLCVITSNMDQTFIATPVNDRIGVWSEGLNHLSNGQTDGEEMSPDSVGSDRQLSSCETSCRGSSENDCCSLSSGEMLIRSNSFCLEEQSLIVISSLDESSLSSAASRLLVPADNNQLSTTLPDAWETSPKTVTEQDLGHPCLGVTFTQADSLEFLSEENDKAPSSSIVALPSEREGGLLMTFICESSADQGASSARAETEPTSNLLGPFTPEHGKTFMSPIQGNDEDIHTSTPVQNTGNRIPSLPSLSPCVENVSNPANQLVKRQQISLRPKQHAAAGLPFSPSKIKKIEMEKNSKVNLPGGKTKVLIKAPHQVTVPGQALALLQKPLTGFSKLKEINRRANVRISPTKVMSCSTGASATSKLLHDAHGQVSTRAVNLSVTNKESGGRNVIHGQGKTTACPSDHLSTASGHRSAVPSTNSSPDTVGASSSQPSDASTQCASSLEKLPTRSSQTDPKTTAQKRASDQIEVRSGSALGQGKPLVRKARPRCSSESSSTSRPPKKRTTLRVTSFSVRKAEANQSLSKPASVNCPTQNKQVEKTRRSSDDSPREVKKISLVAEGNKSTTAGDSCDERNRSSQSRSSPKQRRVPASPRPSALSARQRELTLGRVDSRISRTTGTPRFQRSNAGSQRAQDIQESPAGIKPQLNGSWPPKTPSRPTAMGPPPTPAWRQAGKSLGPSRGLSDSSESGPSTRSTAAVSGGAAQRPTPLKQVLKARLISTPGKNSGTTLTPACKPAASTGKGAPNSTVTPLRRTTVARFVRPISSGLVDKNKSKATSRQQPSQSTGPQNVVQAKAAQCERKDHDPQQLQQLLTASNCRFQALTIVLQQTLAERDEAKKQSRELSQELLNLRGELVSSAHSSERLEKEKKELRAALDEALQRLQEEHQKEQTELEQRLQAFYQDEWEKVRLTYQEEANKCKTLIQQQMEDLKANHEVMKLELQSSHSQQLQRVQQQYERKLEELREVHKQELQSLDKTLKDAEAALSGKIQNLTMENNALIEKLAAEERRRKLSENSQKDSHTLYLEQELESLKVVLEIKNDQLHQQEKKLMEINKLTEKNVKLDESLKKVQQENEDLKARMERHAALSRQLSTEQAMLQESLQKESKVNKRLSMENEELLWKLHNGDLNSPRKLSPTSTSPSHSFSLHSPRSSDLFSSPPVSPR